MDRVTSTQRPPGRAQGFQRWHGLLFSHWEVPAEALRPLVPAALELDAFEGKYYVGVVAFRMQRVRPFLALPPVPTAYEFGEINLRTYVHLGGREPGVFFFSLDAASSLVVWAARAFWGLPYHRSDVETRYRESEVDYAMTRRATKLEWKARATIGVALPASEPGTLEYFLAERYQFYAPGPRGLRRARVHHPPYPLWTADATVDASLLTAADLPVDGRRTPDYYSPGVNVDVFGLTQV